MFKRNRILRNEQDGSPGGGSAPAAPVTPPAPTNGDATSPKPVTIDDVKSAVGSMLGEFRNGIFADLRKTGALKTDKPKDETPAPSTTPGLRLEDVEAMLERERVITARATKYDLNDAQVRRMKAALHGVDPGALATEADSFLADLGLAKATTTTQSAPAPTIATAPVTAPISDKGSPAPGGVLDWEAEFASNPIGMSAAARQRMDAKYGAEKARRMRLEAAQVQAERIKVTRPQG